MPEVPLELLQVRERLDTDYKDLIIGRGGNPTEIERNFRSKALAAFAIHKLSGCTLQESADAIVDGGGDGGIDGLHFHTPSETLWIVQSKFFNNGQGEPTLGDVAKFRVGLENLLGGHFGVFEGNMAFAKKLPQLRRYFDSTSLKVHALLVYSGIQIVSDDRIRMFERLRENYSTERDYLQASRYNLTSVHGWLTSENRAAGIDVTLTLHQPARIASSAPYEMRYGLVKLSDLSALYAKHTKRLITANIREYKGETKVNNSISATLRNEPEHFPYFNNGLTAYCSSMRVKAADEGRSDAKRIDITGFSVVNGAQTLGAIAKCTEADNAPEGFAFIKIISLSGADDERAFAKRITQSTNFQNQVDLRDFAALDDEQKRIAEHLELSGVFYHYKDSANVPDPDAENFDFEEALVSLACLESEVDFCCRVLTNRNSLRSQEAVFGESALYPSRYRHLFRPDRSARTVWRSVQTKRYVIERMQANTKAEPARSRRKAFFTESRWFVLHMIFVRLKSERGEALTLTQSDADAISQATNEIAEALWDEFERTAAGVAPRTFFANPGDCQRAKGALMARLTWQV